MGGKSFGKGWWFRRTRRRRQRRVQRLMLQVQRNGHLKQDCITIDDEISTAEAPTYNVESVCDIGNVEVDGGWQVRGNRRGWFDCGIRWE